MNYVEKIIITIILDGDKVVKEYKEFTEAMNAAVNFIAFADCTDVEVVNIVAVDTENKMHEIAYSGWQPHMLFEFSWVQTGEIIWSQEYPELDH